MQLPNLIKLPQIALLHCKTDSPDLQTGCTNWLKNNWKHFFPHLKQQISQSYKRETKQTMLLRRIWQTLAFNILAFITGWHWAAKKRVCKSIFKTPPVIYPNSRGQFYPPMISRLQYCGFQGVFLPAASDRNVLSAPPGQRTAFLFVKPFWEHLQRTATTPVSFCLPLRLKR